MPPRVEELFAAALIVRVAESLPDVGLEIVSQLAFDDAAHVQLPDVFVSETLNVLPAAGGACDVDDTEKHMGRAAEKFPAATRFTDWRRLFEKHKEFDAVTVSTPFWVTIIPPCVAATFSNAHTDSRAVAPVSTIEPSLTSAAAGDFASTSAA